MTLSGITWQQVEGCLSRYKIEDVWFPFPEEGELVALSSLAISSPMFAFIRAGSDGGRDKCLQAGLISEGVWDHILNST